MDSVDEYREKYELAKRRIISSLDRLRRLGFFEDYSNLTSEELFEKIRNGELGREWPGPWESIEEAKRLLVGARDLVEDGGKTRILTTEETAEKEYKDTIERLMELADFEIDYAMMMYDTKRVIKRSAEVKPEYRGRGLEFFEELVRISRGMFNPDEVKEEMWWESILKEDEHGYESLHTYIPIRFKFRGKEYLVKILFKDECMYPDIAVKQINELIKDTGYQYYISYQYEDILLLMLTEEEAKKLTDDFLGKANCKLEVVRAELLPVQKSLEVDNTTRKLFIESIDYLKRMDFFEDYKNLTSEEIFERIRRGEIGREWLGWGSKELSPEEKRRKQRAYYNEPFAYDRYIACHDKRRVFFESMERYCPEDIGVELLEKLAWISRGVFNPTEIKEGRTRYAKDYWTLPIHFKFRGKELKIKLVRSAVLNLDLIASQINELIKDTGYQYYTFDRAFYDNILMLVLTEKEAIKLIKERGWRLWVFRERNFKGRRNLPPIEPLEPPSKSSFHI
jgi:hypothetical protein